MERALALMYPLHVRIYFTKGRVYKAIVFLFFFTFCINLLQFLHIDIPAIPLDNHVRSNASPVYDDDHAPFNGSQEPLIDLGVDSVFIQSVAMILYAALVVVIPLSLLCVFGAIVLYQLRRSRYSTSFLLAG